MSTASSTAANAWTDFRAISGRTLQEISDAKPALMVFLRHAGCTFCREALADLKSRQAEIEAKGSQIAIIYQESAEGMRPLLEKYRMADVEQFSDPDRRLYEAFRLQLGSIRQLFNLQTFVRGFKAVFSGRHGFAMSKTNMYQMPGAFLVHEGRVIREFRHKQAADRPDYTKLACPI